MAGWCRAASTTAGRAGGRRAHAHVLAGLSTSNGSQEVFGAQLFRAYRATRSLTFGTGQNLIAGFWLNIPAKSPQCPGCGGPFPGPALSLLHKIYG